MVGSRIYQNVSKPDPEMVKKFDGLAAANVCDVMGRLYSMDAGIHVMGKKKQICGTALTIRSALSDNMLFHQALLMAQPGDVIVVNVGGDMTHSVCGDIMYRIAKSKGVLGFIIDGCVRDIDWLAEQDDFCVYGRGAVPGGPYKTGPGEINCDIACGGQVVHPGDLILGDIDGVVVVPQDDMADVYERVQGLIANEVRSSALIEAGKWEESALVQNLKKTLAAEQYEFIG